MPSCVIFGCHNTTCNGLAISYFRFPREEYMKKKWLAASGRREIMFDKNPHVCSAHFIRSSYKLSHRSNEMKLLKDNAVPIVKLPIFVQKNITSIKRIINDKQIERAKDHLFYRRSLHKNIPSTADSQELDMNYSDNCQNVDNTNLKQSKSMDSMHTKMKNKKQVAESVNFQMEQKNMKDDRAINIGNTDAISEKCAVQAVHKSSEENFDHRSVIIKKEVNVVEEDFMQMVPEVHMLEPEFREFIYIKQPDENLVDETIHFKLETNNEDINKNCRDTVLQGLNNVENVNNFNNEEFEYSGSPISMKSERTDIEYKEQRAEVKNENLQNSLVNDNFATLIPNRELLMNNIRQLFFINHSKFGSSDLNLNNVNNRILKIKTGEELDIFFNSLRCNADI